MKLQYGSGVAYLRFCRVFVHDTVSDTFFESNL